jgi:hypothetical protein
MEIRSADKYESAFKEAITAGSTAFAVTRHPFVSDHKPNADH